MALGNREVGIELRARDMASQTLSSVGQGLRNVGDAAEGTSGKVSTLGRVLGPVAQGMQLAFGFSIAGKIAQGLNGAKNAMIGYNQTLQDSTTAMVALSKDAGGVDTLIKNLTDLANNSPFDLPGLLKSSQMLVGLKFNLKDIPGMMTAIGNTAAATGGKNVMEKINSLTQGFVRMQAAGRVTGEVMEVMRNSGVPALDWLAKGFGVTSLEMQKMITKGAVPAGKAMKIMLAQMQSNYGGVAAAQAKTYTGAMSTVKDATKGLVAQALKPLFEAFTSILYALGQFIQTKAVVSVAEGISKALTKLIAVWKTEVIWIKGFVKAVKDAKSPVDAIKTAIQRLRTDAMDLLIGALRKVQGLFSDVAGRSQTLHSIFGPLSAAVGAFADALKPVFFMGSQVGPSFDRMAVSGALLRTSFQNLAAISLDRFVTGLRVMGSGLDVVGAKFKIIEPVTRPIAQAFRSISVAIGLFREGNTAKGIESLGFAFSHVGDAVNAVKKVISDFVTNATPQIEGFVRGAATWLGDNLGTILTGITPIVEALITHFIEAGPKLVEAISGWAMKLVDWVAPAIPKVLAQLAEFAKTIFGYLLKELPRFVDEMMAFGSTLVDWIAERIPDAISALAGWAQSIFDWLINEGIPQVAAAIGPLALRFVDWIGEMIPKLVAALPPIFNAIIDFIAKNLPTLVGKLFEWAQAFWDWITKEAIPKLAEKLPGILATIVGFLVGLVESIQNKAIEAGKALVNNVIANAKALPGRIRVLLLDVVSKAIMFVSEFGPKATTAATTFVTNLTTAIQTLPGTIWGFLFANKDSVVAKAGMFVGELKDKAVKAAAGFASGLLDTIRGLPGRLWDVVWGGISNLFRNGFDIGPLRISLSGIYFAGNRLFSFDVGAWKVPATQPALVHKDEMIIPASIAGAIRTLASGGRAPANVPFPRSSGGTAPGLATAVAAGATGGSGLTIINNFGANSIRSNDDISRISKEMAVQARMQGLTPTLRAVGTGT